MKVVVDAMGGDNAPQEIIRGAVHASGQFDIPIILTGRENEIRKHLERFNAASLPIDVVNAPEVIDMDEQPGVAFRKKRNSSINVGLNLLSKGEAQSFVSAGNSGAVMAGAIFILRNIPSVDRPAIASPIPTPSGRIVLIDAGANVDCKPVHLAQFAVMGEVYARKILGIYKPRVALLNNGEERQKGNEVVKEGMKLIENLELNFVGNIEGRDLFSERADVFVCDGFVGNIVLKSLEGLAVSVGDFIRSEFKKSPLALLGFLLAIPALRRIRKRMDYAEFGGAPLLGVNGGIVICHGASNALAIKNAIKVAAGLHTFGLEEEIKERVSVISESHPEEIASVEKTQGGVEWEQ